jgi:hypothetical protein
LIFGEAGVETGTEQVSAGHGEVGGGALGIVREDGEAVHGFPDHDA